MRSITTRSLLPILMLTALAGASLNVGAEQSGLQDDEQRAYLTRLKSLYLTQDERQALLAHSNALLQTYALRAGYQVGQRERQDVQYSLRLGAPGELLVREQSSGGQAVAAVRNQRLSVYGVDPFVRYECPPASVRCNVLSPADGAPLLSIVRDHEGAAELAKALSFLIRNLQKG